MQHSEINDIGSKRLFRAGGIAPFVTLILYLWELSAIPWEAYPQTVLDWYTLFAESKLKGLFYLNSLDMISISVLGIMFLALQKMMHRKSPTLTTIATPFAFTGIAVFLVPRSQLLSIASLSDRYFAATTEVQRSRLLDAGEAISAMGIPTIQTAGFFIISVAALCISIGMLTSSAPDTMGTLAKIAGFIGIAAFVLTLGDNLSLLILPALATPLLIVAGGFWVLWWVLIGITLLRR